MELLTYIGQVAKRKPRFEERAADLAAAHPSISQLEDEMRDRTSGLVKRLSRNKMRFTEFERAAADDTITSALAGVMLGDGKKTNLKDQTFASATKTMPYLWEFYREILWSLDNGKLEYEDDEEAPPIQIAASGKSPSKYARIGYDSAGPEVYQDMIDAMPTRQPELGKSRPATWEGVEFRLGNYLAAPVYSWYNFGEMENKRRTGFKQARRILDPGAKHCRDCIAWAEDGWQAMGILPAPGERCQCLFNCRCSLEYR
jgi:hypothetical protein